MMFNAKHEVTTQSYFYYFNWSYFFSFGYFGWEKSAISFSMSNQMRW